MTTMYNSSEVSAGGERVGMGGEEGGSNEGERAPMPTGNLDITRALEDTANVLTAPDKVGCLRELWPDLSRPAAQIRGSDLGQDLSN